MSKVTRFNFDDHYQVSPDLDGKHVFLTFADYEALRERAEQAERDREVLAKWVDANRPIVTSGVTPYWVNTKLSDDIEDAMFRSRCTPASREGATIDDGHGSRWTKCSPKCSLEVVRPGKVQCNQDCAECPSKEPT